jgi:hypothetical protein
MTPFLCEKRWTSEFTFTPLDGLIRNVIACREETVNAAPGTTIGELLQFSAAKHGDPFQHRVFTNSGELRSTTQADKNVG